ncbi:MAG: phosphatase, partial [Sphingomonas sp.]
MTDYTDGNIDTNRSANPHLNDLIEVRYSRRQTLMGGLSAATAAVFGGMLLAGCDDDGGNGSSPVTVSAGSSANATAGRPVTLTGNAIGQVDSVAWTQVSGPTVALTNANTATASFIAPG